MGHPKKKFTFQPSIFRAMLVSGSITVLYDLEFSKKIAWWNRIKTHPVKLKEWQISLKGKYGKRPDFDIYKI